MKLLLSHCRYVQQLQFSRICRKWNKSICTSRTFSSTTSVGCKLDDFEETRINKDVILRRSPNEATSSKPMVLIFGWADASFSYLRKYSALYESRGHTTVTSRSYFVNSIFFPGTRGKPSVLKMLSELEPYLPEQRGNQVIIHTFSNGGNALSFFLTGYVNNPTNPYYELVRIKGVISDSCPVIPDFKSIVPTIKYLKQVIGNPILRVMATCGVLVYVPFLVVFNSAAREFRKELRRSDVGYPQLYLFSKTDPLADWQVIDSLARRRSEATGMVRKTCWEDSPHCGHFRKYPVEYENAIDQFLEEFSLDKND